jgi:hypothetical protein
MTVTMPDLAPGVASRVVTIDATTLTEDAPRDGSVTFTLEGDLRVPATGRIIAASQRVVTLSDGKGEIRLPTIGGAVADDAGDSWYILVQKSWLSAPYAIRVPDGTGPTTLGSIAPAQIPPAAVSWALSSASITVTEGAAGGSARLENGNLALTLSVPRGLPGPGATAADTAVAAYVASESETQAALDGRYQRGISPSAYGITGDGTTSDYAAWNAMLQALPAGATVVCPETDLYNVPGVIAVTKPVTIVGGRWKPRSQGRMLDITSSDVTLRDLTIEQELFSPDLEHRIIHAKGTQAAPLERITVDNVKITGTRHTAVWLEWCRDIAVTRCEITDFQYAGIMGVSVRNFDFSGNVIRNGIMGGSLVNCYGIAATDLANTAAARSMDGHIDNNIVDNVPGWEGIDTHSGKNITFNNNVVTRCKTGIAILAGNENRVAAPEGCIASGNTVDAMGIPSPRAGIQLLGVSASTPAYGALGTNQIRGYAEDVIVAYHDRSRTSIAPQATDATTPGSPAGNPFRMWAAVTTFALAGQSSLTREITFPAGLFTAAPLVTATKQGSGGARFVPYVTSVTATGCTVGIYDPTGTGGATTDLPVALSVVQMTSYGGGGVPQV